YCKPPILIPILMLATKVTVPFIEHDPELAYRWTESRAQEWFDKNGWVVGCNYVPSNAINQIEMWQEETYAPEIIDRELGWAASLGFNTVRVFLHQLVWEKDKQAYLDRVHDFLGIAYKHGIKTMLVLFDAVWDPFPKLGKQPEPKRNVHNSGWVQSPGQIALKDSTQNPRLQNYVKTVVSHFATDSRVLGWDVWNEPDNRTGPSYEKLEPVNKVEYVLPLLRNTFRWVREANPVQPVTSGIWAGDWSDSTTLKPIEKLQLEESDVISFHNYDSPQEFEKRIQFLQRYGKPLLCTEYMARPNGSTFQGFLPVAEKYHVAMFNWGFVNGKSQTIYPWDSWTKTYTAEPPLWFHDIFQTDGTPYKKEETDFIRSTTTRVNGTK
ncbi:MAG: 1,4-beta-xylanase, partial [Sphingobacteriales bacterium]